MISPNQLDDLSRRTFLSNTARTAFGVSLGGAAATWFNSAEAAEAIATSQGKAKNVIYLYMAGGMTHIDTFDPKPDAPEEYRGPIKAISTNVAGIQFGQHFKNNILNHNSATNKIGVYTSHDRSPKMIYTYLVICHTNS